MKKRRKLRLKKKEKKRNDNERKKGMEVKIKLIKTHFLTFEMNCFYCFREPTIKITFAKEIIKILVEEFLFLFI